MEEYEDDFAEQLGRYLAGVGFTQQELANKIGMHRNTVVKWMNRTSLPTLRGQVLRVADELSLSKQERKAFIQAAGFSLERWPTEVWTLPQQRDMFFTGRDEVFRSLREFLIPGSAAALTQAISGLGGIGKTHTTVEYAYRFHRDYEAVLWLQADSWETLVSACVRLADELALPEQVEADQVVAEVQGWLRKHRHWLLILDNVEHPQEILSRFVPTQHYGSVLMTTRVHDVEPLAQTQVLSPMSEDEGIIFLLRRTKKVAVKAGREQASAVQQEEVRQIWQLMDGLPLALDQAGAYILETGCSFSEYREQYARRRAELLHRRGRLFIGHKASVATTFSLAFERVEALNPVAADILRVCSLIASEAIPEEILLGGAEYLGPQLQAVAADPLAFNDVMSTLRSYSLIQRNSSEQMLSIHLLVQAVLKDAMDVKTQSLWAERVIQAIDEVLPGIDHLNRFLYERCLPHVRVYMHLIAQLEITPLAAGRVFNQMAQYLEEYGRNGEAEQFYRQSLHVIEEALDPKHRYLVTPLSNLALLYASQGKYAAAESLLLRALNLYNPLFKKVEPAIAGEPSVLRVLMVAEHEPDPRADMARLFTHLADLYRDQGKYADALSSYEFALKMQIHASGREHPKVAGALISLANLYVAQSEFTAAEPLFQRALRILEQASGSEHPDIIAALAGLANISVEQGKYAEAEALYQRALRIIQQAWGNEHSQAILLCYNLAIVYQKQGRDAEAESLLLQSLHAWEKESGPEHLDVAYPVSQLAVLYKDLGKYREAEAHYKRALAIFEQVLGPEHPQVADTLHNLAIFYSGQGREAEAELLYQRVLRIREQLFGPEYIGVAFPLTNLGQIYAKQGKYTEAEAFYQRALVIFEQKLGPEHPQVADLLYNLALLYEEQGKNAEAVPLWQRILPTFEQAPGPEQADFADVLRGLAHSYRAQGRYAEAEPLYLRALSIKEQHLGPEHPDTAISLTNLAGLYSEQGRYEEAQSLCQRALAINEKAYGPSDTQVATDLNSLAIIYHKQGKYAEAETLHLRALHIWEQALDPDHPDVVSPLNGLAILYREQGKYAEAETLYQRALRIQEQVLGSEHPAVASLLNNLAVLYAGQGKYMEAEAFYQRALATFEKKLGPEHPDVAYPLSGLAELYHEQGRYTEAEPLYQRALRIREQVLGSQHPETAEIMHNLARLWEVQGKSEEARTWYARTLAIHEQVLGTHHPKTTETRKHFIALLQATGQHEEAARIEAETTLPEQGTGGKEQQTYS